MQGVVAAWHIPGFVLRGWARSVQRVRRHPIVDPETPRLTHAAVPMFVLLGALVIGSLAQVADPAALLDPRIWLFVALMFLSDVAQVELLPGRPLVLNDLFMIVPFVFLPLGHSAAMVLLFAALDPLLFPRPLQRALARASSTAMLRAAALSGVTIASQFVDPVDASSILLLVVGGFLGVRVSDYLVFPATIRVAVGPDFSFREYLRLQVGLDRYALPLDLPLTLAAAWAYTATWLAPVAFLVPYLVAWRLTLLRPRVDALEKADEVKTRFLSMATHELRTPLTSIIGFAGTLDHRWDQLPDDERRRFVRLIEQQGHRLGALVEDLLTMSKIEASRLETRLAEVDLDAAVDGALLAFNGVDLSRTCPAGAQVVADPAHLERVLVNLVANAIKYGAPPYTVEVTCPGDRVEIRVRDQGEGVPEDFMPHLFERFTQAGHETRRASTGTGLGLSIARALVEAQGGELAYEPNEPRGACFVVRLARAGGVEAQQAGAPLPLRTR